MAEGEISLGDSYLNERVKVLKVDLAVDFDRASANFAIRRSALLFDVVHYV